MSFVVLLPLQQVMAAKILVVGDSLSAGYGIDVNKGWVHLLQQNLDQQAPKKHQVINASVSGETTTGALARLPKLLQQYKPDVMLLELGGNDGLRGQPPQTIQRNLEKMIQLAQQSGSKTVLFGMKIPPNYGSAYTRAFEQNYTIMSQKYKLPLIPFFLEGVAGHNQLMQSDLIHPNEKAQKILLNNALPYVKGAL
ncbi:arylesterase [Acinetobacter sp. B5B]|uniref:arylesterase n=1 Tax=Acinetobacter baretiae TaxID=2605383 RepID=UPI0018C28DBF|nr:arylesterase [Acinetobacter baretiae]MBF7684709.1 arylesterase [Acinetobacter baretiae]